MKSLAEKVSRQLGKLDPLSPIYLWALFEHEDAPGKWDVVLSSEGSDKNPASAIRAISKHLVPELESAELAAVSRIVIIPSEEPSVLALAQSMAVQSSSVEISECNFMGLEVRHAFLFQTQRPPRTRRASAPAGSASTAA